MTRSKPSAVRLLLAPGLCVATLASARAAPPDEPRSVVPAIVQALAPTGKLRAAIDLGNPILAMRDETTGGPVGVSVEIASGLASRLGIDVELTVFDSAGRSVDAVAAGRLDVGFFAIGPLRAADIAFTAPYVLIEGSYPVRDDSPLQTNDEIDRRVAASSSARDLHTTCI